MCATILEPNSHLAELAANVYRAMVEREQRRDNFLPPNPAKAFSASYLLKLAGSLDLNEISTLLHAEKIREQALGLARGGHIPEAEQLMSEMDALYHSAKLSRHAYITARSFHDAANAYLAYRQGRNEQAIQLLDMAIDTCRIMADEFGHDMEFRKVHLGRNIIRAQCFILSASQVVRATVAMVAYIKSDSCHWPFRDHEPWVTRRTLTDGEVLWSIDETLISLALPQVSLVETSMETVLDQHSGVDEFASPDAARAAHAWILAMIAAAYGDHGAMLSHAAVFYQTDPGGLNHSARVLKDAVVGRYEPLKGVIEGS